MPKLFCPNCGNELDLDSKFCKHCGCKVDVEKLSKLFSIPEEEIKPSQSPISETDKEDPASDIIEAPPKKTAKGKKERICKICGATIPSGVEVCPNCGIVPKRKAWIIWVPILLAALVLGGLFGMKKYKEFQVQPVSISASYSGSTEEGTILSEVNKGFTVTVTYRNGESEITDDWRIDSPVTLEPETESEVIVAYDDEKYDLTFPVKVSCTSLTKEHYIDACGDYAYD